MVTKTTPLNYRTKKSKNIRMGKGKGTKVNKLIFPGHRKDTIFSFYLRKRKNRRNPIK